MNTPALSPNGAPGRAQTVLRRYPLMGLALLAIALAAIYWLLVSSDRYVSEARVVLQRSDLSGGQTMDFTSLLAGSNGTQRSDQLLLRDHLLSLDMLRRLDAELQLRQHYGGQGDWLSRLWGGDVPIEVLHEHFRQRVKVELDEYAGVLVVRAQAYTPDMAHAIAAAMVKDGEQAMNALGNALAMEQVKFLEQQVVTLSERAKATRTAVLDFQNRKGLVAPQATAENLMAIIGRLEAQLTELQTRRAGLLGYLQPGASHVIELNYQIAAIEKQIGQERARLAAPGGRTLNTTVEEFQRLQIDAEFAQEIYRTALVGLERGRVEATRTLKKVSVLQSASLPEYPLEPRRLYNLIVFSLVTLMLAGVLNLMLAIVRDHRD